MANFLEERGATQLVSHVSVADRGTLPAFEGRLLPGVEALSTIDDVKKLGMFRQHHERAATIQSTH